MIETRAARVRPAGDAALTIELGEAVDRATSLRVLALDAAVAAAPPPGFLEAIPSFRALLVLFDPLSTDGETIARALAPLVEAAASGGTARPQPKRWRVPVCYDAEFGLDLEAVAAAAGLSPAEVAARHAAIEHHVYMVGFLPGCPYLGDLPPELTLPRRAEPRLRVPAGSVAIAVGLSVVYPVESPGGWHVIGRTPAALFDPTATPPARLAPGDALRFEPIDRATFDRLAATGCAPEPAT